MLTRLKQDIKKAKLKVESKNKSEKSVEVSPFLNRETFSKKEINYFTQETDEKTIGYDSPAESGSQSQALSLAVEVDPASTELAQTSVTSSNAVTPETMSEAFSGNPFISDAARNVQIPDALLSSPGYDINPFEGLRYSQGNTPSRQYTPSSAFSLIKKSIQLNDNLDFNILIHESSKLTKVAGNIDSTMLFLSKQSIFNNTFLEYKNTRIDKNESLLDNTLTFIDAKLYEENASQSVKSFVDTTLSLDRLTTFNRKLEKTINYGNIVENFINTRNSRYNGKIINILTERPNLYTYVVGGKDERLLDRQTQQINTRLKESLLTDFYYDVIDFYSLTEGDEDLSDSIVNQKIVNSDTICGQLMYNTSLSRYTVFPNSSEIISMPSWSTRRQEIIDRFKYLNNFPVIQVDNHFREQRDHNKFLYGKSNNHVLEISGNEFNINSILKNQRPVTTYRTEIPEDYYPYNKFTLINKDYNNIETRYNHIRSLYGSLHRSNAGDGLFIARDYNNTNIGLYIERRNRNLLFDNLLLDVKPDEVNPYSCMNFLILPERYFCSRSAQALALTEASDDRTYLFDIDEVFNFNGPEVFSGNVSTGMSWPEDDSTYENEVANRFEENIFDRFTIDSDDYGQFLSNVDEPYAEIRDLFENKFKDNISKAYSRNLRSYLRPYAKATDLRLSARNNAVTYSFDVFPQDRDEFFEETFGEDNFEMFQSNLTEATLDKIYSASGGDKVFENIFDQARNAGVSTILREEGYTFGSLDITDDNSIGRTRATFAGAVQNDIVSKLRNDRNWKLLNINSQDIDTGVKSDCFVFEGSNTFLTSDELEKWSYNKKKLGENSIDLNYVKTTNERLLNRSNRSNTLSLLYTNTNYHYLYSKICNAVNRIKRKNTPETVSNALKKFATAGKKKIADSESYILLYDNFEETSIDTFENSKFISNSKHYKNNFVKSFSDIKNTSNAFNAGEDFDGSHLFTSREYREYLSSIYTKSFIRDKITLFNRIINDNIDIFESSSSYDTDQMFGFDVLFATALSNRTRESVDSVVNCVKLILVTSLAKLAGIENQISGLFELPYRIKVGESIQDASVNPSYIFSKKFSDLFGEENYKKIVTSIFTPKVVKEQKSFVLRSVIPPSAEELSKSFTSSSGLSVVAIKFLPGKHADLMFPFRSGVQDYGDGVNYKQAGSIRKTLGNAFTNDNDSGTYDNFVSGLKEVSTTLAYNHDVFINSESTGIDYYEKNEDQKKIKSGYKFDDDLEDIGTTLQISYLVNKFAHYNSSNNVTDDSLMPYKNISMTIPFSYFYLSDVQNTFSQKITQLAEDLLKVYEVDFSLINNISDAFDYVENNKVYAKVLQDILEVFSNIFLDSYNNYISYLINYFNINKLAANDVAQKWKFANGDSDLKKKSVDDLILIRDMISSDENVEYIKSKKYDTRSYFDNNDLNIFYTPRIDYLQDVYQLLKNSDISDAIAHDIIHGYFANFEDNLANRNQDISDEVGIISSINTKINAIEGIENFNISDYIDNEYYQNSLSKSVQEISFYKNIFRETFLENNLYNTLQEKYETSNLFNHRKAFVENKYILARQGIKTITDSFANQNFNNYDMICIPIDFMMANKLGEKALVEFSVLPVNLKYPEIEYKELKYYYSSFLTSVTSNYVSFLGEDIKDYIGFFEETEKISERYSVVSKIDMIILLRDLIISKYKQRAIAAGENITGIDPGLGALKIFNDMKMSSAIKDLNFVRQKHYDELVSVYSGNIENLISQSTSSMFKSIPNEKIKQMFEIESIQDILSNTNQYFNLGSNSDILENKEFYKKFLVDVDKEFSDTELVQAIIPNKYYDTFNFIVSRNNFEVADSQEEVQQRIDYSSLLRGTDLGILTDQDTENYFVYYIGAKVL